MLPLAPTTELWLALVACSSTSTCAYTPRVFALAPVVDLAGGVEEREKIAPVHTRVTTRRGLALIAPSTTPIVYRGTTSAPRYPMSGADLDTADRDPHEAAACRAGRIGFANVPVARSVQPASGYLGARAKAACATLLHRSREDVPANGDRMKTGNAALSLILEEIIEAVAVRVAEKLGQSPLTAVYTTHKRGPHFPGKTRDWMLRVIKTMPGAQRIGRDWTIRAADYDAWASAEDTRRCANPRPLARALALRSEVEADDEDEDARLEKSIAAMGFRRSKR